MNKEHKNSDSRVLEITSKAMIPVLALLLSGWFAYLNSRQAEQQIQDNRRNQNIDQSIKVIELYTGCVERALDNPTEQNWRKIKWSLGLLDELCQDKKIVLALTNSLNNVPQKGITQSLKSDIQEKRMAIFREIISVDLANFKIEIKTSPIEPKLSAEIAKNIKENLIRLGAKRDNFLPLSEWKKEDFLAAYIKSQDIELIIDTSRHDMGDKLKGILQTIYPSATIAMTDFVGPTPKLLRIQILHLPKGMG